jgi:effector-binding domain-containing protein
MSNEPHLQERSAQRYVGLTADVTMDEISSAVDEGFPELFGWLSASQLAPSGPPFIRFLVIDMAAILRIELGVPVAAPVAGSERIRPGILPAGRYAVLRYAGHYDGLIGAHAAIQEWAAGQGIEFDTWDTPEGSAWGCRTEHYLTDPSAEPDPAKWETDVAFLTK